MANLVYSPPGIAPGVSAQGPTLALKSRSRRGMKEEWFAKPV